MLVAILCGSGSLSILPRVVVAVLLILLLLLLRLFILSISISLRLFHFFFASHFTFARRISRFIFSGFSIVHCVSSFCVESSNRTTTKTTTTTTGVSAIERDSDSADPQRRLNGSRARNRMSRRATSSNIKRATEWAEALHHQRTRAHASALSHTNTLPCSLLRALTNTHTHARPVGGQLNSASLSGSCRCRCRCCSPTLSLSRCATAVALPLGRWVNLACFRSIFGLFF